LEVAATLLMARHLEEWVGKLPRERVFWDRGVIVLRFTNCAELAQAQPERWQNTPAAQWVQQWQLHFAPVAFSDSFADHYNVAQSLDELRGLRDCPNTEHLTELYLDSRFTDDDQLHAMLQQVNLSSLRHLSLRRNRLTEAVLPRLTWYPWFENLETLDLRENAIAPSCFPKPVERDAPAPHRLGLELLRSASQGVGLIDSLIAANGLGLETLNLSQCAIDDEALRKLAEAEWLIQVRELKLENNAISNVGIAALAKSPHARKLQRLSLSNNPIGDEGIGALSKSVPLANLQQLDLHATHFGADGLDWICAAPLKNSVTTAASSPQIAQPLLSARLLGRDALTIYGAYTDQTQRALERTSGLRSLSLFNAPISDERLERLCAADSLRGLQQLTLSNVNLRDGQLARLLESPLVETLCELDVSRNSLQKGSIDRLCRTHLPNLHMLNLSANQVGEEVLKLLEIATLRTLNCSRMSIPKKMAFDLGLLAKQRGVELACDPQAEMKLGEYLGLCCKGEEARCPVVREAQVLRALLGRPEAHAIRELRLHLGEERLAMLEILQSLPKLPNLRSLILSRGLGLEALRKLVRLPWFRKLNSVKLDWARIGDEGAQLLIGLHGWEPQRVVLRCAHLTPKMRKQLRQRFGEIVVWDEDEEQSA
jgi:Leucine-rich repeat (LRR) protein